MSSQRRLEAKLAEEYELLAQFEEQERIAANPRRRLECRQEIQRQQEVIQSIQEELDQLTESVSIGDSPRLTIALEKEVRRQLLLIELTHLQEQQQSIQIMLQEKEIISQNAQEAEEILTNIIAQTATEPQEYERFATVRAEMNILESEQPRLRQQLFKIKDRLDRLAAETGDCPLCGQLLSEAHRQAVLAELQSEGSELGERFRQNKQRMEAMMLEVETLTEDFKRGSRIEHDQQEQQRKLARAETRLLEIERSVSEWHSFGAERLAELETLLGISLQNEILANIHEEYYQTVQALLYQMRPPELELLTVLIEAVSKQELAQWQGENLVNLTRHAVMELKESGPDELDAEQWCELLAGLDRDKDWKEVLKLTLPLVPIILRRGNEVTVELWEALNDAWSRLISRVTKEQ